MTSIYTNLNAMSAARNLRAAEHIVEKAVEQISTGKRINKPEDDPFMFSSAGRLESDLTMASVSKANINDASFVMSLYANSLETIKEMLLEAKQITMRGASGSASTTDRAELKDQLDAIAVQMNQVQERTKFNGQSIFGANEVGYEISWSSTSSDTQKINLSNKAINLDDFIKTTDPVAPAVKATISANLAGNGAEDFSTLMHSIQGLIGQVVENIGRAGVDMFTLNSVKDFIDESSLATSNLLSSFTDADFVEASTSLAKGQVLSSAAAHMLQQSQQDLRRFVDQLLS